MRNDAPLPHGLVPLLPGLWGNPDNAAAVAALKEAGLYHAHQRAARAKPGVPLWERWIDRHGAHAVFCQPTDDDPGYSHYLAKDHDTLLRLLRQYAEQAERSLH